MVNSSSGGLFLERKKAVKWALPVMGSKSKFPKGAPRFEGTNIPSGNLGNGKA
jgi:hypothetical protein